MQRKGEGKTKTHLDVTMYDPVLVEVVDAIKKLPHKRNDKLRGGPVSVLSVVFDDFLEGKNRENKEKNKQKDNRRRGLPEGHTQRSRRLDSKICLVD
jgi:hypothetical protein